MIHTEYTLFRIDVYFTEYFLAVEIDEKGHTDRDLIFEEKKQKALERKLNCKFIRINTSKKNYDADYEASIIQRFISKFKDKENENKIKKLEDENKIMMIMMIMMILMIMIKNKNNNDDNHNNHSNNHKHKIKIKKCCQIIKKTLKTGKKLGITYR